VSVKSVSSTDNVLKGGVVGAVVNALAIASVKFMLKFLHLIVFRKCHVSDALLEAGKKVFEGLVILLGKVLEFGVGSSLTVTVAVPLGYLDKAFFGGLESKGRVIGIETNEEAVEDGAGSA
jgi:hypothetical protein